MNISFERYNTFLFNEVVTITTTVWTFPDDIFKIIKHAFKSFLSKSVVEPYGIWYFQSEDSNSIVCQFQKPAWFEKVTRYK